MLLNNCESSSCNKLSKSQKLLVRQQLKNLCNSTLTCFFCEALTQQPRLGLPNFKAAIGDIFSVAEIPANFSLVYNKPKFSVQQRNMPTYAVYFTFGSCSDASNTRINKLFMNDCADIFFTRIKTVIVDFREALSSNRKCSMFSSSAISYI